MTNELKMELAVLARLYTEDYALRKIPQVYNKSQYPSGELNKLVKWVSKYFKHPELCYVHVKKRPNKTPCYSVGLAQGLYPNLPEGIGLTFGRALITMGHGIDYPITTEHRKVVGPVTVNSWQEDFVLVLAHELTHISQYHGHRQFRQLEVDAERNALGILNDFKTGAQSRTYDENMSEMQEPRRVPFLQDRKAGRTATRSVHNLYQRTEH